MAATKEASRAIVQRLVSLQLRDPTNRHLFTMHGVRGKIAHDRLMLIARQSLVDTAFDTQAHRDILEKQAQIPTSVFFDRVNIAGWSDIKPNVFYRVGTDWKAERVDSLPSFADITNEQVHELLGYSGGDPEDNLLSADYTISVADRRLQQVCEWAVTEYPKASVHTYGNIGATADDRLLRRVASIFKGLVYATLHMALNPENLTDTKWELLKRNLVTWKTVAKRLTDSLINVLYAVDNRFYDGNVVWLWDEDDLFRARVAIETETVDNAAADLEADAIPEYGLGKDHYTVREILELRQPIDVTDATLSALSVVDADDTALALTPVFASDVTEYTVDAPADAVLTPTATPTYEFATVVISASVSKFTILVESQDQESVTVYTIAVNRV